MARCAKCRTITKGQNTRSRRCRSCGAPTVLTTATDGFSDLRLVKAMDRLSAGGRLAYTDHQLYYAVAPKQTVRKGFVKRLTRSAGHPPYRAAALDVERFRRSLGAWFEAGGWTVGQMLAVDEMGSAPNRLAAGRPGVPAELTAHGFDRALIVEDAATAVMLVANNVHLDHRCAILSEDGYPEAFRLELLELLNRNPALVVAVLHGAHPHGMGTAHRLRGWFPRAQLIEIGLRPDQVTRGDLCVERNRTITEPDPVVLADPGLSRLTGWEREWLAWGLTTPLAALGPAAIMRIVGRHFARAAALAEQGYTDPAVATAIAPEPGGHARRRDPGGDGDGGIWWWDLGSDDDRFDGDDFDGDG